MNVRELRRTLRKIDAVEDRAGHHIYFYVEIDGHEYRVCKFSHSMTAELPPFVITDAARRMKLTSHEFSALVDCLLARAEFLSLWRLRDP
jgi:hypothetical protein